MVLMIIMFIIGHVCGLALFFDGVSKNNFGRACLGVALVILFTLIFIGFARIEDMINAAALIK